MVNLAAKFNKKKTKERQTSVECVHEPNPICKGDITDKVCAFVSERFNELCIWGGRRRGTQIIIINKREARRE